MNDMIEDRQAKTLEQAISGKNCGKRVLIYSGGNLGEWALTEIKPGDVLVGADRGALFLVRSGMTPDIALGDFDSVTADEREEIRRGSRDMLAVDAVMKDSTDTEMAFEWALRQQPSAIVLLGALGSRFDHSLANVHLLRRARLAGVPCRIVDAHNEIALLGGGDSLRLTRNRFTHVSLLPLSSEVAGITLAGFRYPLADATLAIGQSLGVSNELAEPAGSIRIRSGDLLVICSAD